MARIKEIRAREILASGGSPTVEAEVKLESGVRGLASVPFGASAGKYEAVTLVDEDKNRYEGKGMLKAVANIEKIIGPELKGMEAEIEKVDEKMIKLDGTENKSRLGGNAILAVSMAVTRAAAEERKMPLYKYLREVWQIRGEWRLPRPMVVMIEGGKHADGSSDIQEYLVADLEKQKVEDDVRMEAEIYMKLRQILKERGMTTNVGNEGAFAAGGAKNNEEPIGWLVEAIERAGYRAGKDAGAAIDAAASEFANVNPKLQITNYKLQRDKRELTAEEMIAMYEKWVSKYPIVSIEDGLGEDDWQNWVKLRKQLSKILIVGDDLTVTNRTKCQKAVETGAINAILIKLNQAGTVSETMECCLEARAKGLITIPSHRGGGETNDTFMTDLAVAVGSEYIKVGLTRGERVSKYNRLMEIEEQLRG